jgi:hypothetical protein
VLTLGCRPIWIAHRTGRRRPAAKRAVLREASRALRWGGSA